ncbi:MAG: di-heme oxidoredictase family protein, partial [Acidobacteriota bacterium]
TDAGGGFNVGWTAATEWLEYSLDLIAGTYDVSARVASSPGGGAYALSIGGASIGSETVGATGGWQAWQTQMIGAVTVTTSGLQTLRVDISGGLFNLNWIEFTAATPPADSDGDGVDDGVDQCPGTPAGTPVDAAGCPLDSDGDGVDDGADQCPGTPAGTPVDAVGCPVPQDSDGDGVDDAVDQCPGTPLGTPVDAAGCVLASLTGVHVTGADSIEFFVKTSAWADVHYTVNGGPQQNVRMVLAGGVNTHAVGGLTAGDVVSYNFTYWDTTGNFAVDTATETYTHAGAPADSDGDGVVDAADQCPGTPAGAAVDSSGCALPADSDGDGDGVIDTNDQCPGTPPGTAVDATGCPVSTGSIVPLYDASTALEPAVQFETADALVTRFTDRARDRHGKENHFQSYDHYLSFYWEFRTAQIEIIDRVAKGGSSIRMNVTIDHPLDDLEAENRWFYVGNNTLAEYCGNGGMQPRTDVVDPDPNLFYYSKELSLNCRNGFAPIAIGDKLEFEVSQFLGLAGGGGQLLSGRGRANYYGTTFLYIVGEGIVPWEGSDHGPFVGGQTFQRDSVKIPEAAWLGGGTTIHAHETAEPDNHFLQMATNLGYDNGQPFVDGRRLVHTSFVDGDHVDESPANEDFLAMAGKAGPHYINESCISCHVRNGRAAPSATGVDLNTWVFKVADGYGNADPNRGFVLQPSHTPGAVGEGTVSIASWTEQNGLRSPNFAFSNGAPASFSARIAPAGGHGAARGHSGNRDLGARGCE